MLEISSIFSYDELRMKRIKDTYLSTIQSLVSLEGKTVLEVGCGDGTRTIQIANHCAYVTAIEPNVEQLEKAKREHPLSNGKYLVASADALPMKSQEVDVIFFTLSFHHVPIDSMHQAIDEALRVIKPNGYIIFLEPAFTGTFFDAEISFDACDGDERKEKAAAYLAMLSHVGLREVGECTDETVSSLESVDDFIGSLSPKKGTKTDFEKFLKHENYILRAGRRINVFQSATEF